MSDSNYFTSKLFSKTILREGTKDSDIDIGSKVYFHFQAKLCDEQNTILDDSRKFGKGTPFELIIGREFKLPVWEDLVKTMKIKEIASFIVDKDLVMNYPFISKTLRDKHAQKPSGTSCAAAFLLKGFNYDDLNKFLKNPVDIKFIIELLYVQDFEDYDYTWKVTKEDMIGQVPVLKESGDAEFQNGEYSSAEKLYSRALATLEDLLILEIPNQVETLELKHYKKGLLLKLAESELLQNNYYAALRHYTELLRIDPNNTEALLKRAKCYVKTWAFKDAKEDLNKALELDGSLSFEVKRELNEIDLKLYDEIGQEEIEKYQNLFSID